MIVVCHVKPYPDKMGKFMEWQFWCVVLFILQTFLPGVHAFDAGDAIALVLGLVIGTLGICACLGYYARRRGGS